MWPEIILFYGIGKQKITYYNTVPLINNRSDSVLKIIKIVIMVIISSFVILFYKTGYAENLTIGNIIVGGSMRADFKNPIPDYFLPYVGKSHMWVKRCGRNQDHLFILFNLTNINTNNREIIIDSIYIDVIKQFEGQYTAVLVPGPGTRIKYNCILSRELGRYECEYKGEGDFLKIENGKTEQIIIWMDSVNGGIYETKIVVKYSFSDDSDTIEANVPSLLAFRP